jgi:hypothetical protein
VSAGHGGWDSTGSSLVGLAVGLVDAFVHPTGDFLVVDAELLGQKLGPDLRLHVGLEVDTHPNVGSRACRFWLIRTNVDRKIASRETTRVSRPKGNGSNCRVETVLTMIQNANQTICR